MIEQKVTGEKPRILIVEDENLVALDIERGLKRLGYDVIGAVNNGGDAIKKADELSPDLILMDIQIKGEIDGVETTHRIHEKNKIPVVFLTAHADEATLQRAKLSGPFGYVLKPFDETELHTSIQVALQKHRSVIEQERLAKQQLETSEEKFSILVDSVRDYAICILDLNGKVSSWNWGAQRIFGYKENEILGKHFSYFSIEEDCLSGIPQWEMDQTKNEGFLQEEGWRTKKGSLKFWAFVSLTRMNDSSGTHVGYAMVTRDLTERKRAEDKLRLANESLEKRIQDRTAKLTEALQTRDEFLSIASHELRNPLSTMCLQLSVLSRHIKDFVSDQSNLPESLKSANTEKIAKLSNSINSCERQSKRLAALIDQLLDLTRIRAGKIELNKELLDLTELTEDIVNRQRLEHANGPEISLVKPKIPPIGRWDRPRMEQIITNLLSNAFKYGEGKPIEIMVDGDLEKQTAQVSVTDHGMGIPINEQQSIFEKFQRASDVRNISGLGLGLYIVKQIVEAHDGHVYVKSLPKQGSTFFVEIPFGLKEDLKATDPEAAAVFGA